MAAAARGKGEVMKHRLLGDCGRRMLEVGRTFSCEPILNAAGKNFCVGFSRTRAGSEKILPVQARRDYRVSCGVGRFEPESCQQQTSSDQLPRPKVEKELNLFCVEFDSRHHTASGDMAISKNSSGH